MASRTMTAAAMTKAPQIGTPRSIIPTKVRAANSTIVPWAKLNTPDALKINTKPSATSEYMTPLNNPPMTTSSRNSGLSHMFPNGVRKRAWRKSIAAMPSPVRQAEIGVDDFGARADLVRRAVGNLAAVVEHDDAVGDVHHDAHIVLDQCDRRAELVVDVEDEAAHVLLLLDIHPRHRLVEQQEFGLHRQCAAELDALLQPVGQPPDRGLADRLDFEKVDDPLDPRAVRQLFVLCRTEMDRLPQKIAVHL